MAKLDTLKERMQIRDIIRLGAALTCILMVIGGTITHSKNYIEIRRILTDNEIPAIFSLKDFEYDVAQGTSTGVYNLKLESEKIGELYTVDLTSEEISIELQLYEFVDENIDDYFEKILINEKIYNKKIYVHEKENYEEVIDGMERIDEKKWDVDIAYQYTKRNQVTYYFIDENKLIVIHPTFELTDVQIQMIIERFKEERLIGNPSYQ